MEILIKTRKPLLISNVTKRSGYPVAYRRANFMAVMSGDYVRGRPLTYSRHPRQRNHFLFIYQTIQSVFNKHYLFLSPSIFSVKLIGLYLKQVIFSYLCAVLTGKRQIWQAGPSFNFMCWLPTNTSSSVRQPHFMTYTRQRNC